MATTPKKISELTAAAALTGSEALPAVQGGANVRASANQLRTHILKGVPPLMSRPFVELWADGDSKAGEPARAAQWVIAKDPREVSITQNFGVGSSQSSAAASPLGLTNATRMATIAAALNAAVAAGSTVDIVLTIGTNDISTGGMPETIVANVRKYHNHIRANGARFLILMAIDPRTGLTGTTARSLVATNRAYADYCQTVPDAIFCDATGWWQDPASTAFAPIGGATGGAFAMAADGLHANAYGVYSKQFALAPIFQALYRPRSIEVLSAADTFDAADALRGNILGANGRFLAMGGTNSFSVTGSGAVTGTPPAGTSGNGTLDGSVSLAYSAQNNPNLAAMFGSANWPCVRVALSGTPATSAVIQLAGRFVGFPQANATPMIGRALIACTGVTGLAAIYTQTQNVSPSASATLGVSGTPVASDRLPQLDGLFSIDFFTVPTSNINSGLNLIVRTMAGVALGGSIDLIGIDWRRWDAVPAASA